MGRNLLKCDRLVLLFYYKAREESRGSLEAGVPGPPACYFVPNILSPASPRPGTIYFWSLRRSSSAAQ